MMENYGRKSHTFLQKKHGTGDLYLNQIFYAHSVSPWFSALAVYTDRLHLHCNSSSGSCEIAETLTFLNICLLYELV